MAIKNEISRKMQQEFGKKLRQAREDNNYSRKELSILLNVSEKTIQLWETGSTFTTNLSHYGIIEKEFGLSFSECIKEITNIPQQEGVEENAKIGPIPVDFSSRAKDISAKSHDMLAIPRVHMRRLIHKKSGFDESEILDWVFAPSSWFEKSSKLVACFMNDNSMREHFPKGSVLIFDTHQLKEDDLDGQAVLIQRARSFFIRNIEKTSAEFICKSDDLNLRDFAFDKRIMKIIGRVVGRLTHFK